MMIKLRPLQTQIKLQLSLCTIVLICAMSHSNYNSCPMSSNLPSTTVTDRNKHVDNQQDFGDEELWSMLQQQQLKSKSLDSINKSLAEMMEKTNQDHEDKLSRLKNQHQRQLSNMRDIFQRQIALSKERIDNLEQEVRVLGQKINLLRRQLAIKEDKLELYQDMQRTKDQSKQRQQRKLSYTSKGISFPQLQQAAIELAKQKQLSAELTKRNEILCKQIKNLQSQLSNFYTEIDLNSKELQVTRIQIKYYKQQNFQLQEEIKQLKDKLLQVEDKIAAAREEQKNKWWRINENLMGRINSNEKSLSQVNERQEKLYKQIQKLKDSLLKEYHKNKQVAMQAAWYRQLLQQAKGQFVEAELQKQSLSTRLANEKNQLLKQTRRLKEEVAVLKDCKKSDSSPNRNSIQSKSHLSTNVKGADQGQIKSSRYIISTGTGSSKTYKQQNKSSNNASHKSTASFIEYPSTGLSIRHTPDKTHHSKGRLTPKR